MKGNSKVWIAGYLALVIGALAVVWGGVMEVDPFFHYHKPDTEKYFYTINNQRSQNDGISKNFEYDALITGTSMTENFKASEMDEIFGTHAIKVPFSGGSFKEINDHLINALSHNPKLSVIVRGLDISRFTNDKDNMRTDLGKYPTYLYDNNPFNDVRYVFNRDIIFNRVYPMIKASKAEGFRSGITSFDAYSNWMGGYTFGIKTVCPDGVAVKEAGEPVHLTEEERATVLGNVRQNITSLAERYPEVTFYYFFTPYSIAWWQSVVQAGTIYKQLEAEELVIEEILKCSNIRLYSFNNLTDITTDLNHYKDTTHYGSWINSLMLHYMYDGKCLLTGENYKKYLEEELAFYLSYDYVMLNMQEDYENDYYAEALLNQEINGVTPVRFSQEVLSRGEYNSADVVLDQHNGTAGIECKGRLERVSGSEIPVKEYMVSTEYAGCKMIIEDIEPYQYLVFYGKKNRDHGQPSVYLYNENGEAVAEYTANYHNIDGEWRQYLINVSQLFGRVTVIFNGGYIDSTGSTESLYTFSDIVLY